MTSFLYPKRVGTITRHLPGPAFIAKTILSPTQLGLPELASYRIEACLENFEKAGYIHIRSAFEILKTIGISDVTDVEFWDACIRMGKSGSAETIEIQEDFKDFT